jgi:hypothetical protein
MPENIGMAELSTLDLILQREERDARETITHSQNEIEYLLSEVERQKRRNTTARNLERELLAAMAARNVPVLDS